MCGFKEAYSESDRTTKMELLAEILNEWKLLTNFEKNSILDVLLGSEYTSTKLFGQVLVCNTIYFRFEITYIFCHFNIIRFFISVWGFFHEHWRFTGQQGKGKVTSVTPLYHFHPFRRHLDFSRAITARSSPLYIATSPIEPRTFDFRAQVANY